MRLSSSFNSFCIIKIYLGNVRIGLRGEGCHINSHSLNIVDVGFNRDRRYLAYCRPDAEAEVVRVIEAECLSCWRAVYEHEILRCGKLTSSQVRTMDGALVRTLPYTTGASTLSWHPKVDAVAVASISSPSIRVFGSLGTEP